VDNSDEIDEQCGGKIFVLNSKYYSIIRYLTSLLSLFWIRISL